MTYSTLPQQQGSIPVMRPDLSGKNLRRDRRDPILQSCSPAITNYFVGKAIILSNSAGICLGESLVTFIIVRSAFVGFFSTTKWWSARRAIWCRWVITITWQDFESFLSLFPTSMAVLPPMPASTSSNTSAGGHSPFLFFVLFWFNSEERIT